MRQLTLQMGNRRAHAFDKGGVGAIRAIVELAMSGMQVSMEHKLSDRGTMQLLLVAGSLFCVSLLRV